MEWQELIIDSYGRILEILESALEGLTQDDLNVRPHSDSNSIGWLVWHLTRVQDNHVADLMGEEQLWIKDEWYSKFNRASDRKDIGFGHSSETVETIYPQPFRGRDRPPVR
ncbi:MAG: DinB family protein [Desulfobacterales bacterium]|nr:DinB family protein [Desulfobacterales bacterium]